MFALRTRAIGILAGSLADALIGDPPRGHPVALFGGLASALERVTYRDARAAGVLHTGVLLVAVGVAAAAAERRGGARLGPAGRVGVTAVATWAALGGTSLTRIGRAMAALLSRGDIDAARRLLPSLCGRDPYVLDADGLARAALESVAENTSDAHVAPLLWAAAGGVPGVLAYRCVNTLDAMIGHRSPHYVRFGWAAARLDDGLNYVPARVAAALVVLCAPVVGGSSRGALRVWRRDATQHPSPNAGVVEAAFAGALGLSLGGPTQYSYGRQIRPTLGDGRSPTVADLRRGVRLSRLVQVTAAVVTVGALSVGRRNAQRRRSQTHRRRSHTHRRRSHTRRRSHAQRRRP